MTAIPLLIVSLLAVCAVTHAGEIMVVTPSGTTTRSETAEEVAARIAEADRILPEIEAQKERGRRAERILDLPIESLLLDSNTQSSVRSELRTIRAALDQADADARAIAALSNSFTAAQNRATVNDLRRELIDLVVEVRRLRKQLSRTVNEAKEP